MNVVVAGELDGLETDVVRRRAVGHVSVAVVGLLRRDLVVSDLLVAAGGELAVEVALAVAVAVALAVALGVTEADGLAVGER